uniref:Uncharacterized protein n=1 Tax=Plectus sambesii TaxID=2011161 RepID=A0A914XKR5_9BILA
MEAARGGLFGALALVAISLLLARADLLRRTAAIFFDCFALFNASLDFQRYWVHYWYPNAKKQDQFLKLVTFTLYFLTSEIYWQRNVMDLGLVSAGILLLSLAAMWLTQLVIFKYFEDEAVLVGSGFSSADSGHMFVKAGNKIVDIIKENGLFTADIKPRAITNERHFQIWQYFCIPTLTYGIMGRCRLSRGRLFLLFDRLMDRLQGQSNDYNFSYQSCQEIALSYAAEITEPEESIAISLTRSKSLFIAIPVFLPGLLLVAWSRLSVSVQWRRD